jgi:hypothetical protein
MVGSIPIYSRHIFKITKRRPGMSEEFESQVISSHVVKCPVCDGNQGVVLVWNDGDVDFICIGCKHKERLSLD